MSSKFISINTLFEDSITADNAACGNTCSITSINSLLSPVLLLAPKKHLLSHILLDIAVLIIVVLTI